MSESEGTQSAPPERYSSLVDVIVDKVGQKRDDILFHHGAESYTYGEVHRLSNSVAASLREIGLGKSDRISLLMGNSPEFIVAWFGIAKLGAVFVPLNTNSGRAQIQHIIDECGIDTILLEEETREKYESVRSEVGVSNEYLLRDETDSGAPGEYDEFNELLDGDGGFSATPELDPSDPSSIIYTSGTTGQPKGVVLPHFSYVNTDWEFSHNILELDHTDRVFTHYPLFHCNPQQTTVIGSMLADARFVLADSFDPDGFWDQMREMDVTVFNYIGNMLSVLSDQGMRDNDDENPVQYAVGANAPPKLLEQFEERFGVEVIEGYGMTETAAVATANSVEERRKGSIGKPLRYTQVQIVDENDRSLPRGEKGEIVVRPTEPNAFMVRYFERCDETIETQRNLWLHTGDIGYRDPDGFVYFVDRKEYTIYRHGEKISSTEIEEIIDDMAGVKDAAVVGVPKHHQNQFNEEDIKAFVVTQKDATIDPIDVARFCDRNLPYNKLPRYIEIVDALPRTPTQRIAKYKLMEIGVGNAWDREVGHELNR